MLQTRLLKKFFILLAGIGIFWELAEIFYFHWTIWWYDVVLHFSSGFSVGMAFMIFFFFLFSKSYTSKRELLLLSFFFVLTVGTLWEIFELYVGYTSLSDGIFYVRDTTSDFIADLSGGLMGTIYSFKFFPQIGGKISRND